MLLQDSIYPDWDQFIKAIITYAAITKLATIKKYFMTHLSL